MPKKRETAKEKREKEKEERLLKIAKKIEDKRVKSSVPQQQDDVTPDELREYAILEDNKSDRDIEEEYDDYAFILKKAKSIIQTEIEKLKTPVIYEIPEFLLNPKMEDRRKEMMEKIRILLKYRFSLVFVADMLQCNDYSKLDELIEYKDRIYNLVKEKTRESEEIDTITLFSKFKKTVGSENSRIYAKQEDRMKVAISSIYRGTYFKLGDSPELALQDIISEIIDHPEFNRACRIETEYMTYELDRLIKIFSELKSRSELESLIDELKKLSETINQRSHAYNLMDELINGITEKTIDDDDDSQRI